MADVISDLIEEMSGRSNKPTMGKTPEQIVQDRIPQMIADKKKEEEASLLESFTSYFVKNLDNTRLLDLLLQLNAKKEVLLERADFGEEYEKIQARTCVAKAEVLARLEQKL